MTTYALSADVIACYPDGSIVMIERKHPPFQDLMVLPGGHLDPDETLEQCACREAMEEIGLHCTPEELTLVGVYSGTNRDPRYRVIAACYIVPVTEDFTPKAGSDAKSCTRVHPNTLSPDDVGFDHYRMLFDADLTE